MKEYQIPIIWQTIKTYNIKAVNLEEAIKEALSKFFKEPTLDGDYLEDSFEIDDILEDNYPEEQYNLHKIYNEL